MCVYVLLYPRVLLWKHHQSPAKNGSSNRGKCLLQSTNIQGGTWQDRACVQMTEKWPTTQQSLRYICELTHSLTASKHTIFKKLLNIWCQWCQKSDVFDQNLNHTVIFREAAVSQQRLWLQFRVKHVLIKLGSGLTLLSYSYYLPYFSLIDCYKS